MGYIFTVIYYSHCKKDCLLFKKLFRNIWYRPIYSPSPAPEYEALYIGPSEASLYNIVICLSVMDVQHGFYRDPTCSSGQYKVPVPFT